MGIEVRKLKSFPYVRNGIDNTSNPLTGEDSIKSGIMNVGAFMMELDIRLTASYPKNYGFNKVQLNATDWRIDLNRDIEGLGDLIGVGDRVHIQTKGRWWTLIGVVIFSDNNTIELTVTSSFGGGKDDEISGNAELLIRNLKEIESIDVKYNLTPKESSSFANGFDGGNMIFSGSPIISSTEVLTPATGSTKNWILSQYQPTVFSDIFKEDYEITPDFDAIDSIQPIRINAIPFVVPYWNESLTENYEDNTQPDITVGDNTLKGIFEVKVWRNVARDHDPIIFNFEMDGDIGWYEESGNGGESLAEITDTSYFNLSKIIPSTSLDIDDINEVTIVINRTTGVFNSSDKISLFVAKKVLFDDYNQSNVDHGLTYIFSGGIVDANGVTSLVIDPVGKGEIKQLTATLSNANATITLKGVIQFNQSSKDLLNVGDEYILSVGYYDSMGTNFPQLLADQNTYNQNTDENGLVLLNYARTYDPDGDISLMDLGGYTESYFWLQDGINNLFSLRQNAGSEGEILSMRMSLLSLKDSADDGVTSYDEGENFVIVQTFDIPFSKTANNAQGLGLYEGNLLRQFNLKDSDPFKLIEVSTIDNGVSTDILIKVPLKINWQHWNKLEGVPDVFFNDNDSHNGFNERTSNYSEKPVGDEFSTKLVLFVDCQNKNSSGATTTAFELPVTVYNYGEDQYTRQSLFPDYIITIETQKLDGTPTNGKLSETEPTRILFSFANQGRQTVDKEYYFFTRLEPTQQTGFDIYEISTLQDPQNTNPLEPVMGETRLKVTDDGLDNFVTECVFNPNKLSTGNFTLSARIGRNENAELDDAAFTLAFSLAFKS